MRRLVACLVVLALHGPAGALSLVETGGRDFHVHVPEGSTASMPLVVVLHGCTQTAEEAEAASGFSALADELGFVVVYPEQSVTPNSSAPLADGNGMGCWNWFLPDHQQRGAGEPAALAAITQQVVEDHELDASRVYVYGVSAGGAMAVNLAAAYPDRYAAVAVFSGCAYATCTDHTGVLAYQAMGSHARVVPMLVAHGTADTLNPFVLGQTLVGAWLGTSDWADDGAPNGSVSRTPASVEHHGFEQTPEPGSGDPCVRERNWPCLGGVAGFQDTYPYTVARYEDASGCGILDFWAVHGLGHGQPNASEGPFTDPLGPDLTSASYDFFMQHSLDGLCTGAP